MITPNLVSADCYGLGVEFPVDLGARDISRMFGKQYSRRPDWNFIAYQEYTQAKRKHYCFLLIHPRTERLAARKARLHVDITFGVGSAHFLGSGERRGLPRALDYLEKHRRLLMKRVTDIAARFHYDGEKYSSDPELPLPYAVAGFESSEIVGARIRFRNKALAKKPQASIAIQMTLEKDIHQKIDFSYIVSDVESFFPSVLELASAISRKFCRTRS